MKYSTKLIFEYLQAKNPELLKIIQNAETEEDIKVIAHTFVYGDEINKFGEWAYEYSMKEHSLGLLLFTSEAINMAQSKYSGLKSYLLEDSPTIGEGVELLAIRCFQDIVKELST